MTDRHPLVVDASEDNYGTPDHASRGLVHDE